MHFRKWIRDYGRPVTRSDWEKGPGGPGGIGTRASVPSVVCPLTKMPNPPKIWLHHRIIRLFLGVPRDCTASSGGRKSQAAGNIVNTPILQTDAVILATSRAPKLYTFPLGGRTIIDRVLDALAPLNCNRKVVVCLADGADRLCSSVEAPDVTWITTDRHLGTANSLVVAAPYLQQEEEARVLVLSGSIPRVTTSTLEALREVARGAWGSMAMVELASAGVLGRVILNRDGSFHRVIEAVDASPEEFAIRRVNAGLYCLPLVDTLRLISRLETINRGEVYFSDVLSLAAVDDKRINLLEVDEAEVISAEYPPYLHELIEAFERERQVRSLSSFLSSDSWDFASALRYPAEKQNSAPSEWDLFICHASEDKEKFVRPLAQQLINRGLRVWFDEHALCLGDSIRRQIDRGLAASRFGVVVLSPSFFAKEWPQIELDALTSLDLRKGKKILPVWHQVTKDDVLAYSPTLADRLAVSSAKGIDEVVRQIAQAVSRPESSR
jgi:CTP:molybdopterin cytidylyltransferase MocA